MKELDIEIPVEKFTELITEPWNIIHRDGASFLESEKGIAKISNEIINPEAILIKGGRVYVEENASRGDDGDVFVHGFVSNCCSSNVYYGDICYACGEHCSPVAMVPVHEDELEESRDE